MLTFGYFFRIWRPEQFHKKTGDSSLTILFTDHTVDETHHTDMYTRWRKYEKEKKTHTRNNLAVATYCIDVAIIIMEQNMFNMISL